MAEQIKNWYDRRDAWLYEQTKAGAWVQPPRDQYRDVMYILHLEGENAALREKLEKAVELPRIIHPNDNEWHIQWQYESGIIDSIIMFSREAAEVRLEELKGEKK